MVERDAKSSNVVLNYCADGTTQGSHDYNAMGWKGFEQIGEAEDPVAPPKSAPSPDMDMTPMVDVTFLLLIFFMVTASFSLQKSLPLPDSLNDQPGPTFKEEPAFPVTVTIDQNNTFHVSSQQLGEFECPSEREMRDRLRDSIRTADASQLMIHAHIDSQHGKLVAAWDGGVVAGVEKIVVRTTEEQF